MIIPVFRRRSALSLTSLDVMGDILRKNEQTLKSLGAVPRTGAAKAALAWYVPSPVSGVGSAVGFTCVSPGTIGAVDISRAYEVPLIINGKLHIPMAHNRVNHEIDPEDVTVDYLPGAVDSIDVREGTPATLEHGTICLPLAQSPETEADDKTGEEYEVTAGWAGLLAAAEFTSGISSPVMQAGNLLLPLAEYSSGVSLESQKSVAGALAGVEYVPDLAYPEIHSGVLCLPVTAGGAAPASFIGTSSTSVTPGGLYGAEYSSAVSVPAAVSGLLKLPLANYGSGSDYGSGVSSGSGVSAVTGAIAAVETISGITSPYIATGVLCLPPAGGSSECMPASFSGVFPTSVSPGGLRGIEYSSAVSVPAAIDGLLQLPLASSGSGVSAVTGAIAAVETISGITSPYIATGVLCLPPTEGSPLLGLQGLDGSNHTWEQVAGYAGSQVQVAGISLRTGENTNVTLYLNVGIANGYLSFSFST